jgi:predicted CopG family antitoxin
MVVKNISIMEDVYRLLLARKRHNESFSDVIRKTMKNKNNIMDLAGAWKNVSDEDSEKIKDEIRILRKKSTKELANP